MASIFSFFTGSGFLDLGFEKTGFNTALVNEFHAPFLDAYKYSRKKLNHPEPEFGHALESIEQFLGETPLARRLTAQVKKVQSRGDLAGFIGGPPCPDFSVGGKNKGHEGENGRLSQIYIDAIVQHKPDFFLFENVKGLWRTKRHRAFYEALKITLQENGYVLTDQLVNCIQYGAPQDRDRILLFGIKKELVKNLINKDDMKQMRISDDVFAWEKEMRFTREEALKTPHWPDRDPFLEEGKREAPSGIIEELTIQYWFNKNDVTNHANAKDYFTPRAGLPKFQSIDEGDDGKKSYKRLHRWRYSPTAAYGNNEVHLHPYKARRISAAEALALQSLPKEFVFPKEMTLSNKFKTIGNGVPFLAAKGIAKTIDNFINKIR